MQSLYCDYNKKYPVWAISHAGHCSPPPGMDISDGKVFIVCLFFALGEAHNIMTIVNAIHKPALLGVKNL